MEARQHCKSAHHRAMRKDHPALYPAHARHRGQWRRVRPARNSIHAQARAAAALGIVQGARRLRQSVDPGGAQSRHHRGVRRQSRRGRAYAAMRLGKPAKIFVPSVSSPAKIAAHPRIRRRSRDRGRPLCGRARGQRERGRSRPAHMPVHAFDQAKPSGPGNAASNSSNKLRYRYGPRSGWRRRADRRYRRLVCRPHQGRRRRAVCVANADQGARGRTSRRCGGWRPRRGFARAAARRRTRIPDRTEICAADRAGYRRRDRRMRRRRYGAPCASWRSPAAPPHSRRSCPAPMACCRRAGRHCRQRRQHGRGELRRDILTGAPPVARPCGYVSRSIDASRHNFCSFRPA